MKDGRELDRWGQRTARTRSLPRRGNDRQPAVGRDAVPGVRGSSLAAGLITLLAVAVSLTAAAQQPGWKPGEHTGTIQSTRLYTKPDPTAGGGIRGQILMPTQPLLQVFALPDDDPTKVYKGAVVLAGKGFSFTGLPVGKYGLLLLYEDRLYEGLELTREDDTLTLRDRDLIKAVIMRSVPFFDTKAIHRCAGTTGEEGKARCVLQELRTKLILTQNADEMKGMQIRSIKLVWLEDVGNVGWQFVNSREIVRTEVAATERKGILAHAWRPRLGNIRVIDTVKDLGALNLEKMESE